MNLNLKKIFLEEEIKSYVRFNKEMMTVYDLSYLLIDFQAIINNLTEIICNNIGESYKIAKGEYITYGEIAKREAIRNDIVEQEHPRWQKEIEDNFKSFLVESNKKAANFRPRTTSGLKQTTSRKFNEKYRMNLKLNGFSKGSLVLDLANSLIVSIFTDFLKELATKKTGNPNIININIHINQYIQVDGETVNMIPKDSCIGSAIKVNKGSNQCQLDIQKCIHDIVEVSKPDENIEASVRRLLLELERSGVISKYVIYDERGIKTVVRDIERFIGNFMDIKI